MRLRNGLTEQDKLIDLTFPIAIFMWQGLKDSFLAHDEYGEYISQYPVSRQKIVNSLSFSSICLQQSPSSTPLNNRCFPLEEIFSA